MSDNHRPVLGPIAPINDATLALHPLGVDQVRLMSGPWGEWQRANHSHSLPHAIGWIEREGTADNFRRLHPGSNGEPARRGLWFNDSNLYKTLESAAWDLAREPHKGALADLIADYARVIADAQQQDGYLNTFVQAGLDVRWDNLVKSHELFCIGHLIQAGIAHHRAVPESQLFDVARKAADAVVRDFGELRRQDNDGHEEIEIALVELYRETGERSYLNLAQQFIDLRGKGSVPLETSPFEATYYQDGVPVRDQTTVVGHAVRAVFLLIGVADLYMETGETALLDSVIRQWESMTASKTYLTGALGSRIADEAFGDPYELPADLGYGETCATVANVMLSMRLLLITGESRFADAIDRALNNLVSASTGLDRTSYFYSNPAHRRAAHSAAAPGEASHRAEASGTRPEWYACSCCPGNVMRLIASLGSYIATADASGVQLHQYISADVDHVVGGERLKLSIGSELPLAGSVVVTIGAAPATQSTLSLRVPDWSSNFVVSINGEVLPDAIADDRGYVRLTRSWEAGDVIVIATSVAPRLTSMHPAIDAMRGTLAIERGPLVYALESRDQIDGLNLDDVGIDVSATFIERVVDIDGHRAIALEFSGWDRQLSSASTWVHLATANFRPVRLVAIPYYLWANRGPSSMRIHIPVVGIQSEMEAAAEPQ